MSYKDFVVWNGSNEDAIRAYIGPYSTFEPQGDGTFLLNGEWTISRGSHIGPGARRRASDVIHDPASLEPIELGDPPHDGLTVSTASHGVAIFATDDPYEGAIIDRADVEWLVAWLTAWLET